MAIGRAERARAFDLDRGECQFWHDEPCEATEFSHFIHQGAGGLPEEHWINKAENGAASCRACHDRLRPVEGGRPYRWEKWDRLGGVMVIRAPNGRIVPEKELWFFNRNRYRETGAVFESARQWAAREREAAWNVARELRWLAEDGIPKAVNGSADWIDLAIQLGYSSAEARRRVRAEAFRFEVGLSILSAVDIDVADRFRKIDEKDLEEVASWFSELPLAEAWSRFNERYPGKERRKKYRAFVGEYREVEAASEREALEALEGSGAIIVRGGSVIRGTRSQGEAE